MTSTLPHHRASVTFYAPTSGHQSAITTLQHRYPPHSSSQAPPVLLPLHPPSQWYSPAAAIVEPIRIPTPHPQTEPPQTPPCTKQWCQQNHLCLLTLALSVMVTINAALLLWLLSYINFDQFSIEDSLVLSQNGASTQVQTKTSGHRQIMIHGGLQVNGAALEVNTISSPNSESLRLLSNGAIRFGPANLLQEKLDNSDTTINTHEANSRIPLSSFANSSVNSILPKSWFQLGPRRIVAFSSKMVVKSAVDDNLLLLLQSSDDDATRNKDGLVQSDTIIGVDSIQIQGIRGLNLSSSIQVPNVFSASDELYFYAPNRRILLRGPKHVNLAVSSDDLNMDNDANQTILLNSFAGVRIESKTNKILLNVTRIHFTERFLTVHASSYGRTYPTIGQLCVCARSGRIFIGTHHRSSCLTVGQFECNRTDETVN